MEILDDYDAYQERYYQSLNLQASSTAKLAQMIAAIAASFGGEKEPSSQIEDWLPVSLPDKNSKKAEYLQEISKATAIAFSNQVESGLLPGHVQQAFIRNSDLWEAIKTLKKT